MASRSRFANDRGEPLAVGRKIIARRSSRWLQDNPCPLPGLPCRERVAPCRVGDGVADGHHVPGRGFEKQFMSGAGPLGKVASVPRILARQEAQPRGSVAVQILNPDVAYLARSVRIRQPPAVGRKARRVVMPDRASRGCIVPELSTEEIAPVGTSPVPDR